MTAYEFAYEVDPAKVTKLLSECYGRGYDADYVRWMSVRGVWFVASRGRRLVGCYGLLPLTYDIGGVLVDVGLINNVGVVPDQRGGALFASLGLYAMEKFGASAYLGVSNDAALRGHGLAGLEHAADACFLEGQVFEEWSEIVPWPENGPRSTRDDGWREWRYSKPGEFYVTPGDGSLVCKVHGKFTQVVESPGPAAVRSLGVGARVGMMASSKSTLAEDLMRNGFEEKFSRHLVVGGALSNSSGEPPRVEPCDYDVF